VSAPAPIDVGEEEFAGVLRRADRTRYLAALFAPESVRPALHALGLYAVELERIVRRARDPVAAEVRLQWWRDAVADRGYGAGATVPLVRALREAMGRYAWPPETLAAMSEARIHDLYADPFADTDAFDGYAGEAHAAPLQLAAMALAMDALGEEDGIAAARSAAVAAGHGGVALAAADTVLAERERLAAGRTHIPLSLWREAGARAPQDDLAEGREPEGLGRAVTLMAAHGAEADEATRTAAAGVAPAARPALLPAFTAQPVLRSAAARPLSPRAPGPLATQWRLWRAARVLSRPG